MVVGAWDGPRGSGRDEELAPPCCGVSSRTWKVQEIDVDEPKEGEVLVAWKAAGLCHSDEHLVTGDMVPPPEMLEMMGVE